MTGLDATIARVTRVSGKESECPDCTEPVPDEDGE